MTAHELANHLLEQPDYDVIINGWGTNEGIEAIVDGSVVFEDRKELHLLHEEIKW